MEEVASNSQLHCSKNMGGRGADAITGNQGLGHCESRGNSIILRTGLRVARVALCLATFASTSINLPVSIRTETIPSIRRCRNERVFHENV